MDLSVIIVNYNVRYFLEQALLSVERAVQDVNAEVWVVDNNSADSSVEMVRERFPWVKLVSNKENPGFSVANNQAIRQAAGKHILLLNPDTVVEEDTFLRCLSFMEQHPDCGGLGVRMIDGRGQFLPESKRGLPTPWVAFTKAFGLARIFPRSPRFNHYHLGYLAEDKTHEVEILAGAFMWMRREALDKVGLLDETFFMYGEDIDLSYRIILGGYKNYYYPGTSIIHYKGESTKRGSLNYVRVFYQAMIIFARKHFSGSQGTFLVWMMQLAIYVRAAMTIVANLWQGLKYPLLEAAGIYVGLRVLKNLWANYHFGDANYFSEEVNYLHFPAYTIFWVGSVFLSGGYDRPFELRRTLRSMAIGTLGLFAVYGLLSESLRPSRALLLLGAAWSVSWIMVVRGVGHFLTFGDLSFRTQREPRLLIVGSNGETNRTLSLLQRAGVVRNYLGRIAPEKDNAIDIIGRADRLEQLAQLYRAEEIIFCSADLSNVDIQRWMTALGPDRQYRILPEASSSIIGSHRSDSQGTLYTINVSMAIDDPTNRRGRWLFNRGLALAVILLSPLLVVLLTLRGKVATLGKAIQVLVGKKSWVGYAGDKQCYESLPPVRNGIFDPALNGMVKDPETLRHLNFLYARDYTVGEDWRILWRGFWG